MKQAIDEYCKKHTITKVQLAQKLGVSPFSIDNWRKGRATPFPDSKNYKRLVKLGIVPPTREGRRAAKVQEIQEKQDKKNMVKRPYRRSVIVPDILAAQLRSILDEYITNLGKERTWGEFQELRDTFIRDAYYLMRQSG